MSNAKKSSKKIILTVVVSVLLLMILLISLFGKSIYISIQQKIYPIKFGDYIEAASEEFDVPQYLICAIIKAESNFKPDAESSASAKGLMQLMPDTYTWLAKKLGEDGDLEKIKDPLTNIRYGTYYISTLLKKYGNTNTALCAYNAGPGRVDSWLCDTRYSSDGKTISVIPYPETEKYVKKINGYQNKYKELYYDQR